MPTPGKSPASPTAIMAEKIRKAQDARRERWKKTIQQMSSGQSGTEFLSDMVLSTKSIAGPETDGNLHPDGSPERSGAALKPETGGVHASSPNEAKSGMAPFSSQERGETSSRVGGAAVGEGTTESNTHRRLDLIEDGLNMAEEVRAYSDEVEERETGEIGETDKENRPTVAGAKVERRQNEGIDRFTPVDAKLAASKESGQETTAAPLSAKTSLLQREMQRAKGAPEFTPVLPASFDASSRRAVDNSKPKAITTSVGGVRPNPDLKTDDQAADGHVGVQSREDTEGAPGRDPAAGSEERGGGGGRGAVPRGVELETVTRVHRKLAPVMAMLTQVKSKLASGDLNAWRLNAEVSQLVADAHLQLSSLADAVRHALAPSTPTDATVGSEEAGEHAAVAAAVRGQEEEGVAGARGRARRELELEVAKLQVRLAKTQTDRAAAAAEAQGRVRDQLLAVLPTATRKAEEDLTWDELVAALGRAVRAAKKESERGEGARAEAEREAQATILRLEAELVASREEAVRLAGEAQGERRERAKQERAMAELKEKAAGARHEARALRLEQNLKEVTEALEAQKELAVVQQNKLMEATSKWQSAERALQGGGGRKRAGEEVERVKGELEGAMDDLQRAHKQLSKLRDEKMALREEVKGGKAELAAWRARAETAEAKGQRDAVETARVQQVLQQRVDERTNQLLQVQDRLAGAGRAERGLKRQLRQTGQEREALARELEARHGHGALTAVTHNLAQLAVLRAQHRDALLLIRKYERVIRHLAARQSAGAPDDFAGIDLTTLAPDDDDDKAHKSKPHRDEEEQGGEASFGGLGPTHRTDDDNDDDDDDYDVEGWEGARVVVAACALHSEDPPLGAAFSAARALAPLPDDATGAFWLLPDGAEGGFVVDLGTQLWIHGVRLKNTRNNCWKNRGARRIDVLVSDDPSCSPASFQPLLSTELPCAWDTDPLPLHTATAPPARARFLRLLARSHYGLGAGLNLFQVLVALSGSKAIAAQAEGMKDQLQSVTAERDRLRGRLAEAEAKSKAERSGERRREGARVGSEGAGSDGGLSEQKGERAGHLDRVVRASVDSLC